MPKQLTIATLAGIVLVGIGIALLYAQPKNLEQTAGNNQQLAPTVLEVSEKLHDFGTVSMKNGKVSKIFRIKNTQSEALSLNKLYTSCMCTEATLNISGKTQGPFGMPGHGFTRAFTETLQPQEEATVEVVFDPNAHGPSGIGTIERAVTLENTEGIVATIHIKATVTP
jgi:hypothetical protein